MGIPKLIQLITSTTGKTATKLRDFKHFYGMTVGIDASLLVHQAVIASRSSGRDMVNQEGSITSHLNVAFYKILAFLENGMTPIFVFDGPAHPMKSKTLEKRQQIKIDAKEKIKKMDRADEEEYIKTFKKTFTPTKQDYLELQIMLDLMGIPYIMAPGEADSVLAWLCARRDENGVRYIKGVCSDDSDVIALGAPYMFKGMLAATNKTSGKQVTVISLDKTLTGMNLTYNQFIDLCVLLGCDYCTNIKTIGPKKSYNLIKSHKNLKNALEIIKKEAIKNPKICIEKDNVKCMYASRDYFRNALDEIDKMDDFVLTDDNLKLRFFQYEELMDFMCVKHGFDVLRIESGIKKMSVMYSKMKITRKNTKDVHTILRPRSEDFTFLPSESSSEEFVSKKTKKNQLRN